MYVCERERERGLLRARVIPLSAFESSFICVRLCECVVSARERERETDRERERFYYLQVMVVSYACARLYECILSV